MTFDPALATCAVPTCGAVPIRWLNVGHADYGDHDLVFEVHFCASHTARDLPPSASRLSYPARVVLVVR